MLGFKYEQAREVVKNDTLLVHVRLGYVKLGEDGGVEDLKRH